MFRVRGDTYTNYKLFMITERKNEMWNRSAERKRKRGENDLVAMYCCIPHYHKKEKHTVRELYHYRINTS